MDGPRAPKRKVVWLNFILGIVFMFWSIYFISFCFWGERNTWLIILSIIMIVCDFGLSIYHFCYAFRDWILDWTRNLKKKWKKEKKVDGWTWIQMPEMVIEVTRKE